MMIAAIITSSALVLTTLGVAIKKLLEIYKQCMLDRRLAREILDNLNDEQTLAIENLAPGLFRDASTHVRRMWVNPLQDEAFNIVATMADRPELDIDTMDEVNTRAVLVEGLELDNTPVKERRHRRLPRQRGEKTSYIKCVIAEVKAKVGTLSDKEANRMVIRRVARGLMEAHGLRPTHQQAILPLVIEGALTPGSDELLAEKWGRSLHVRWRRAGGNTNWFSWFSPVEGC